MTTTYDITASVPYDDELRSGFVVLSPSSVSWWYGGGRGWGTTFGPLDHSVRVYDSRVKAASAIRHGYNGPNRSRLKVQTIAAARAVEANRLEAHALSLLDRVNRLRFLPDEEAGQ